MIGRSRRTMRGRRDRIVGPPSLVVTAVLPQPAPRLSWIYMALTRSIELRTQVPGPRSREILERKQRAVAAPLAATFPIEQTRDAVTLQAGRHVHGKIVITL